MNLFQIIIKQMRQRALSTWLTTISVLLGVALAVGVMILRRESQALFGMKDFGYELIIGPPKGSPLQLTLNTVYHLDVSPGNIPYSLYEDLAAKTPDPSRFDYRPLVKIAVPFMVGDSYNGRRIVGTSPEMFGIDSATGNPIDGDHFEYQLDKRYELAQGHVFHRAKFEAVLGSDAFAKEHFALYDDKLSEGENEKRHAVFQATHGFPGPNDKPDIHKPKWHVVGALKPTHTANDRVLFVPVISLYAIAEHEPGMIDQALIRAGFDPASIPPEGLDEALRKAGFDPGTFPQLERRRLLHLKKPSVASKPAEDLLHDAAVPPVPAAGVDKKEGDDDDEPAYTLDGEGAIVPDLPRDAWEISAVLVKARGQGYQAEALKYRFRVANVEATAVSPAEQMRDFFATFFKPTTHVMLIISLLVSIVAGVAILVSIYNSVSARLREIAILRALGATRRRIVLIICLEAAAIGLVGGLIGMALGHATGAVESYYFNLRMGQGIDWWSSDAYEWLYLLIVVGIATLAGLVPALKAYRVPVATNLAAD